MEERTGWYRPTNAASLKTPSVLVFPERIRENIRRMITIAGDAARLRPHVKTHKMAEVVKMQVELGITRFKCATLTELSLAASNGAADLLLAYPLLGPDIKSLFQTAAQFPGVKISVIVDSLFACEALQIESAKNKKLTAVFVDLDNGMHRTGIAPDLAPDLIHAIQDLENLSFSGLHIYDGHIHDSDPNQRKARCQKDFEPVLRLISQLKEDGIEISELACGGTPTFPIHALYGDRTLCPGTPLLWDAGYEAGLPDLDFLPAAVVLGRIISKPREQLCLDLGHKSIASEMDPPRLKFLDLQLDRVLNHSEEHMVISSDQNESMKVGDLVYALPIHVCPTMALHEEVYVVENKRVGQTWKVVARKRDYTI
jgi:D-serine deaminase-like pyridoxal phosphate-dependent protein